MAARVEDEFIPPDAQRVAKRALVMCAIISRAFIDDDSEQTEFYENLKSWVNRSGLIPELEPAEKKILYAPMGAMTRQQRINWTWRSEGLVVLAWALKCVEFPPHDQCVDPDPISEILGFLSKDSRAFISSAQLRPENELNDRCGKMFALHWRFRQFALNRRAIDFAKVAREAGFGPAEVRALKLVSGDLSIGGLSIAKAPADVVRKCESVARERHCAANWLCGYDPIYSEVATDT